MYINLYSFIIYLYLCSLPPMVTGGVQQVSWNNLMALDSSPIEVEIVPWHFTSILCISLYTFLIIFAYVGFHACFYVFILLYVRTSIQIGESFRQRPIDNHIFTPNFWSL